MRKYILSAVLSAVLITTVAQNSVVDKIIAIVGDEIILKSDIENEFLQEQSEGTISSASDHRVDILERQLVQKLLLAQSKLDSIQVTESEVESEVAERMQYFTNVLGSKERVESYFNKGYEEILNDLRGPTRERLITTQMQMKIVDKIRTTPSEVKNYYKKLSKDSLPDIPDKFEVQQIVLKPKTSEAEKERIRERLRGFREQIVNGEKSFNTLAVLYSEDGSAARGGELGYMAKTDMVPEFAEAVFSLKPGRVSKIVETEYGFHIIQLIDRQGERVNARHILLRPKVSEEERKEALLQLDSIRKKINIEEGRTFESAAFLFSTDKQTKNNGGLLSSENKEIRIERSELPGEISKQINSLKVGEMSQPFVDHTSSGEEYKIIKLKAFYPQHKANLEEDWAIFEEMLKREKQMEKLEKWVKEKQASTYISIDESYRHSKFRYDGWVK